jgi:uncharacterized protein YdeI (YjbR/CyaY-like superfamily)
MIDTERFEKVEVASRQELRAWLSVHHSQDASIWLVTFKKHVPDKYVSTSDILDEVLCFGWIDGLRRKLDDQRTMQLIGPRRHQQWAQTYKTRADQLIREGLMLPVGLAPILALKKAGQWDHIDDVDALVVPPGLTTSLKGHPQALKNFMAFSPSSRRNVLRWISAAKTAPTRQKRIEQTATLAAQNKKVPQM